MYAQDVTFRITKGKNAALQNSLAMFIKWLVRLQIEKIKKL